MTHPSPVDPQQPEVVSPPLPAAGSEPPAPPQYPSASPQYPPAPLPPMTPPPFGGAEPPKTMGVLSLIFGAAALLFGLIPVAGIFIGGLFGTASIVLGIIGILKSHKIMSIIGIVLSVVGAILSFSITGSVTDDFERDLGTDASGSPTAEAESDAAAGDEAADEAGDEAAEPEIAGVGDTVADGDFEFTVGGFEQGVAEVGGEYLNEQAQGEFVIIDITVKNIGSEAAYFTDGDQLLFDTEGNEYSANSAAGMYLEDNDVWLTEINPGNQVQGKIVFDVPAGTTLASLELHDSMFSGGIEVSLQ